MPNSSIPGIVKQQNDFFKSGKTKDVAYRKKFLNKLLETIQNKQDAICEALYKDFRKPEFEAYATEITIITRELKLAIKNVGSWAKPKNIKSTVLNFPSSDAIYKQPYGTVLIISPWNYPFHLAVSPLIGAIAAGNTAVIKPSELTPATSELLSELISEVFPKEYVSVVTGGIPVAEELLSQKWDYVFFTGSVKVGKIVAKAVAENLTPTTLELGGKNPCIVDETAKIKLAAKRIVWGKFLNAGQTCIAPDYVLADESVFDQLTAAMEQEITNAYGIDPQKSTDYARIINPESLDRLESFLKSGTVLTGGKINKEELYLAPTLLLEPSLDSDVMEDEIFGPILPVLRYHSKEELSQIINRYPSPLSLYVFSSDKGFSESMIESFSFGGGTINDTIVHFVNHRLPFGGVGTSGMGAYHGKGSFDTFSHKKAISKRATWLDIPLRYAPYNGKLKWLKRLSGWV